MRNKHKTLDVTKPEKPTKISLIEKTKSARWNQILSGIVCVVGFILIFFLTLYLTIYENEIEEERLVKYDFEKDEGIVEEKCQVNASLSTIECKNFKINDNLSEIIDEYVDMVGCIIGTSCRIRLTLDDYPTKFDILREGWLVSDKYKLKSLSLNGVNVIDIEPKAFVGNVFKVLEELVLSQVTIEDLTDDIFYDLDRLNKFEIRDSKIFKFGEMPLRHISSSLKILQIQNAEKWDPKIVTGSNNFPSLETVDFRFNNFADGIDSQAFKGLTGCSQIFLSDSEIHNLPCEIFKKMVKLKLVNLSNNQLKTMDECVFGTSVMNSLNSVQIDGNLWDCNCDLLWLKELPPLMGSPKCTTPYDLPFNDTEFCGEITTSFPGQSTTSESPPDMCTEDVVSTTTISGECDEDLTNEHKSIDFEVRDVDKGVMLIINKFCNDYHLIMFSKDSNIITHVVITQNFTVELEYSTPYTFCLKRNGFELLLENCKSHVTEESWEMRSWIRNEEKGFYIGIFCFGLLLCVLFGAFIVFIIVRRYPTLLRGSKRIIMVKKKTTRAVVMPSGCGDVLNSSSYDSSFDFRTGSTNMNSMEGPYIRRSASEASMISGSYVSPTEPTTIQLLNWRLNNLRSRIQQERTIPETPPPLPERRFPNRPSSPNIPIDFDSVSGISIP